LSFNNCSNFGLEEKKGLFDMKKVAIDFLKDLVSKPSPSGWEEPGQEVVVEFMRKYADGVSSDTMGNVHGVLNAGAARRIMLAGHCDEIGLMVQHIDEQGFIIMSALGGVNVTLLPAERVIIKTAKGDLRGVVGAKPIHLLEKEDREKAANKIHELWVDIGAKDRKDAEKYVALGDIATIDAGWIELKNGLVACRGFDNRIGSFVVADVLRRLKGKKINVAVHAISTVQEEVGLRGARVASYGVDPHLGIAVDVGFSTDCPGVNEKILGTAKLGSGPILHCGPTYNKELLSKIQKAATQSKISTQFQPENRGQGTDAFAINMTRAGVPAALLSVPSRYMHSPVETIALDDLDQTAELIAQFIAGLSGREAWGAKKY
jgi:tetrahedral aminopeptidase